MDTVQLHLRIDPDEADLLDTLAGKSLNRQAVARMLLTAAIEAVQKNQGKLHFPPRFVVADDSFSATAFRINEPQATKRK